ATANTLFQQLTSMPYGPPTPSRSDTYVLALVSRVEWTAMPGNPGRTLKVYPTGLGRASLFLAPGPVFNEVEDKAGSQLPDTMYNQLWCHAWDPRAAYGKESWNLDEWRPNEAFPQMELYHCNP